MLIANNKASNIIKVENDNVVSFYLPSEEKSKYNVDRYAKVYLLKELHGCTVLY